ncbi:threonylcarbamoyl-AMP synthase [Brachybacterium sp. P6-10-X1]|uniref:L-threonylcarbamoyladenylate synthase n=1 Tax=Brachybacterium sp. P6-10-X1 TaxID=1903186 RepID=UPI000971788F|nr:L-threonylcarbamoyladenylate synthase [Brachybacterium sp. P6-10-X1]APX32288.1 threonylcarbamoyl-AMP synthase [Brachybacterium sp. P6-10-X1]
MSVHDTQNPESREAALTAATQAVRDGKLIVLPTDTVYGIGADAFTSDAVADLLEAKGRGRDVPPPVLIGDHAVLLALALDVPEYVERLAEEFWPGPLTLILNAQPSLTWDLGETRGTVALRMPDDEIALDLLRRTGPLAVSSANRHGKSAALTVLDAATQLGDAVEEYLDGGTARLGTSSTIIDTTVEPAEIVREGSLSAEDIVAVVGDIFTAPEPEEHEETKDAGGTGGDATSDGAEEPEVDGARPEGDAGAVQDAGEPDEGTTPEGGTIAPSGDTAGTSEDTTEVLGGTPAAAPDAAHGDGAARTDPTASAADAPEAHPGVLDLPSEPDLVELSTTPTEDVTPDPAPSTEEDEPGRGSTAG